LVPCLLSSFPPCVKTPCLSVSVATPRLIAAPRSLCDNVQFN
jgi:hypothetical protein